MRNLPQNHLYPNNNTTATKTIATLAKYATTNKVVNNWNIIQLIASKNEWFRVSLQKYYPS